MERGSWVEWDHPHAERKEETVFSMGSCQKDLRC